MTSGSHTVRVLFNSADLGAITFVNTDHPVQILSVPAAALRNGDNTVQLTALGGSGDVSLIDTLRLTYAHIYVAENDVFPETFINFLAFDDAQRAAFMQVHGEILRAEFWRHVQQRLNEGELLEVLPYQPKRVRVASSA